MHTESSFTFITTNKEKIETARMYLDPIGITFETESVDMIEPQSDSIESISAYKAKQAQQVLQKPVVVTDHGWFIAALNGFPGAYMKYINEWFGADDFLRLMSRHVDRSVTKREVITYSDGKITKQFTQDFTGVILDQAKGEGLPAMQVVSLSDSGKSVAECVAEGIDPTDGKHTIWKDFSSWLSDQTRT